MSCGDLNWNQKKVTCVRRVQSGCNSSVPPVPTAKPVGRAGSIFRINVLALHLNAIIDSILFYY